ncbi:uncharacterized protein LOC118577426 isoform X1 [Onychomys torridus]|uniref:uncharacterized protein LOC118577426 isoform X1 n=1 Tax=Onychomys torridus TaxID=38674 RepID=UPI00167FD831|nr:uncharacterized protein LOC118577426 isoform X1 [Onychomys torridus]
MPLPSERPLSHLQVLILQLGTSGDSCSCWQSKPHLADVSAGCRRNVSAAQVHFQIWMNTSTCHIGLLEMYEAQNNACQHTGKQREEEKKAQEGEAAGRGGACVWWGQPEKRPIHFLIFAPGHRRPARWQGYLLASAVEFTVCQQLGCFRDLPAQEGSRRPPRAASGPSFGQRRPGFQRCPRVKLCYILPGNEVLQVLAPSQQKQLWPTALAQPPSSQGPDWLEELGRRVSGVFETGTGKFRGRGSTPGNEARGSF